MHIRLPRKILDDQQIDQWEEVWNNTDNITYSVPNDLSVDEINGYFCKLINKLPNDFALTILCEIAEIKNTPWDLLQKLFEIGDTSCMVSICCRPDLPDNMLTKCLNSSNPDVLEHVVFHKKVSTKDCEALLQRPLENHTLEAIRRAISQKREKDGT
jgi:hypothetical protein